MRLTRRRVIAGGVLGLAGLIAIPYATRRIDDEIYRILERNFGRRIASAQEAELFISDIAANWTGQNSRRNQIVKPTYWMLEFLLPVARRERANLEENVVHIFLRATNAVRHMRMATSCNIWEYQIHTNSYVPIRWVQLGCEQIGRNLINPA